MSALILTVPQSTFADVGRYGPYVSAPLPPESSGYRLEFTKANWPAGALQDVCGFTVELSLDGGQTWQEEAYRLENNGNGQTPTDVYWNVAFGALGTDADGHGVPLVAWDATSCMIRLTLDILAACDLSITAKSLP